MYVDGSNNRGTLAWRVTRISIIVKNSPQPMLVALSFQFERIERTSSDLGI